MFVSVCRKGSSHKEPAHGQSIFQEGAGYKVICIVIDEPTRIAELVSTKRPNIHTLTFPIDDFAVITQDMINAICLEQTSDGLFLLVYQIDLLMMCQLQFQLS